MEQENQSKDKLSDSAVVTTQIDRVPELTEEQKSSLRDIILYSAANNMYVTPYDGSISVSDTRKEIENSYGSTSYNLYRKRILDDHSNNPLIKLLTDKDKNLKKTITKLAKEQKKEKYLVILDTYGASSDTGITNYLRDILDNPRLTIDKLYIFYALSICAEIVNLLVNLGVEASIILSDTEAPGYISTKILQKLLADMPADEKDAMLRMLNSGEISSRGYGSILAGKQEEFIQLLKENTDLFNDNLSPILDVSVRFNQVKSVKYVIDYIATIEAISQEFYIGFFNSVIQAIIRANQEICLQFVRPEIWSIFRAEEQLSLLRLIALRAGETTTKALIDSLIENGLFNITTFISVLKNNPTASDETVKKITNGLREYHEYILKGMIDAILINVFNTENADVVVQLTGMIDFTKDFSRSLKAKVIKEKYLHLEPYLEDFKKDIKNLDILKYKEHHVFLSLLLNEQNSQRAAQEIDIISTTDIAAAKPVNTQKAKVKNISIRKKNKFKPEATDEEEVASVIEASTTFYLNSSKIDPEAIMTENTSNGDDPDEDQGRGALTDLGATIISIDQPKERLNVQLLELKNRKTWVEVVRGPEPSVSTPKASAELIEDEPEEIKLDAKQVDGSRGEKDMQSVIIAEVPDASTIILTPQDSVNLDKFTSTLESPDIQFESFVKDEVELLKQKDHSNHYEESILETPAYDEIQFGSFGLKEQASTNIDDQAAAGLAEDELLGTEASTQEEVAITNINNSNAVSNSNNVAAKITIDAAPAITPICYWNPYYFGYQTIILKTQWLITNTGKLIYSLQITNSDNSIAAYNIDPLTQNLAQLTIEEYRSFKPSAILTHNHKVFFWTYTCSFTVVEINQYGSKIFEYTIDPIISGVIADSIIVSSVPVESVVETIDEENQITGNSNANTNANANVQSSSSSTQAQQHSASVAQNSLSNEDQQNKIAILTNFKEKEIEFVEISLQNSSSNDLDITDPDDKEYKESKKALDKRFEEEYVIKVQNEDSKDKVNVTYYNANSDETLEIFKPLSGEYDLGSFKIPSMAYSIFQS